MPILTRIAAKFQVTVPTEIRELFALQEGDLFQWEFDAKNAQLCLIPKRAQLITPLTRAAVVASRGRRKQLAEATTQEKEMAARAR